MSVYHLKIDDATCMHSSIR